VEVVTGRPWEMSGVPVLFKSWTPFFDSKTEKVDKELLWVRLPGFPMNLWKEPRFAEIGNFLGEYVCSDQSFHESCYYTVARILVKIDLKLGLSSEISIKTLDGDFTQVLDYDGVPFRCHRCRAYGHLVASCPLPHRDSIRRIEDFSDEEKGMGEEENRPADDEVAGVEGGTDPVLEVVSAPCAQVDMGKAHMGSSKSPSSTAVETQIPAGQRLCTDGGALIRLAPQTRAVTRSLLQQADVLRGTSSTPPGMSMSIFSSPALSFCSEFVAGGGGVVISGAPPALFSPVASCTMPPSESVFTPSIVSTNPSSSSESWSIRYALRNREISVENSGGKGLADVSRSGGGRGRGRKSHFSKAQERAKVDVVMGTQSSIEWAIRAVKAQGGVVK